MYDIDLVLFAIKNAHAVKDLKLLFHQKFCRTEAFST